MKVAMYYNNNDVRIEYMDIPKIGDNEILVNVKYCGICGSDVMEWYRRKKAPCVLGHEISGVISKIGKNVKKYKVGERVFVSHHVPCNNCVYCLRGYHTVCHTLHTTNFYPGGFSEYIKIPKINIDKGGLFVLPDEITDEEAVFIEPLGCVIRGWRIADFKPHRTVLVIGSGVTGILHIQYAKTTGANKVIAIDINKDRLKKAIKFGADETIYAKDKNILEKILRKNNGQLCDYVIVCTGSASAIDLAFKSVDKSGTILFFAPTSPENVIIMPFNELWSKGVTITSTYASSPRDISDAIALLKTKKIKVKEMISHILPLDNTGYGFKLVAEAKESLKVIIDCSK